MPPARALNPLKKWDVPDRAGRLGVRRRIPGGGAGASVAFHFVECVDPAFVSDLKYADMSASSCPLRVGSLIPSFSA